jgi:hypothetical protein
MKKKSRVRARIKETAPLIDLTAYKRSPAEKRPELYKIEELYVDPKNPRLAEVSNTGTQASILKVMEKEFELQPLIDSLYKNGYFWEEPMVAVREPLAETKGRAVLVIIEGNRRLAALKLLLAKPSAYPDQQARDRLKKVPVLVRDHREETLAFVGFRHITGIKQWEAAAKAQYALGLVKGGHSIEEIAQVIGDKTRDIGRWIRTQSLVETAAEQGLQTGDAAKSFYFSYLLTATDAPATKRWLDLKLESHKGTVESVNSERLRQLWTWLYGSREKRHGPIIAESRQIHSLNRVLANPAAVNELEASGNLERALAHTKSREAYIAEVFGDVRSKLQDLLAIVSAEGPLAETPENRKAVKLAKEEFGKLTNVLGTLQRNLEL